MTQVKGDLIRLAREYLRQRFPPDVFQHVLDRLSPQARWELSGELGAERWYDLGLYQQLLDAFQQVAGTEALTQCGLNQAEEQLQGLFGIVARLATRSMLINGMNRMWRKVFDQGRLELLVNEPNRVEVRAHEFSFTDNHLRITEPYLARVMELTERRLVRCRSERRDEQTTDFLFEL